VSVITIVLYFVTSSDSGSLVVDLIAANGREAHVIQRVFWALSEGGVAIVLMKVGGSNALGALRALSIIAGLPFTFVMCYMCTALWRALKADASPNVVYEPFKMPLYAGIFDALETVFSCGKAPLPAAECVVAFFKGMFVPPLGLYKALRAISAHKNGSVVQDVILAVGCALSFYAFVLFHILGLADNGGFAGIAWAAYILFVVIVAYVRHVMRLIHNIEGNGAEDFFAVLMFFPQVLAQLEIQADVELAQLEIQADVELVKPCPAPAEIFAVNI